MRCIYEAYVGMKKEELYILYIGPLAKEYCKEKKEDLVFVFLYFHGCKKKEELF